MENLTEDKPKVDLTRVYVNTDSDTKLQSYSAGLKNNKRKYYNNNRTNVLLWR